MNRKFSLFQINRPSYKAVSRFCQAGLDFVYPPSCCFCHGELSSEEETSFPPFHLCLSCQKSLIQDDRDHCRRCGASVGPFLDTTSGCMHCRQDRFAFDTVVRFGVYREKLRLACLEAKKPHREALAAALGELLWQQKSQILEQTRVDLVIPVPQHWFRKIRQRHNTAETLARTIAHRLKVDFHPNILSKIRKTPAQTSLTPSQRRRNLRRAFRVRGRDDELSGLSVLLVDDVLTTGTTANQAAKALKKAGAERVVVCVVARGLGQRARRAGF